MKNILILSFVLLVTGCAASRGFNRDALRQSVDSQMQVSDGQINKALALKAQLPKPFKLGIYFQEPEPATKEKISWSWTDADKQKVISAVDKFKNSGEISKSFVISPSVTSATDLKSLRLAAAQSGADALMIVSGVNDIDSYTTQWAWSYIAIIPAFVVPASVSDVLFITRASMWDVRNEFLYMTAESESLITKSYPAVFRTDRKQTLDAKDESLNELHKEIVKRLENLSNKRN